MEKEYCILLVVIICSLSVHANVESLSAIYQIVNNIDQDMKWGVIDKKINC